MTTSLSSLLAATLNQSTGSTSSTPISLSSAGNVDGATHSGNRSTVPAITNTALSKAVALDNAAKAVVERVPERLLSISISANSTNNAPSSSVKSALLALNVVLPAELNTKLSKQAINNAQLALLPQSAFQGQPNTQSAVLFSTSSYQRQVSLPASDKAELIKTVAQSLANNNAAVTLKGQLSISTKSESFGQLMLTTVKNDVVPISDINTEKLDGTLKAALQKLIGQQVVIGLSRASNSGVALNISPELSTGNVNPSVNRDNLATIDHKNVSTNLQLQLISSALKQGGVAVEHNSDNTSRLSALLESSGANSNALKVLSALALTNDKLSVRTTQQNAFLQINLPQGNAPSLSLPTLTQEQINKLNLTQLSNVTAKGFETISESGLSVNSPPTADVKTEAPTSLKGTEVHSAVTALSRILLSQTGSTNKALSQLIAIIENGKLSSNTGATNAINLPPFDKILMQLKGIDALNAKPSQAKVFNGEFIGPPKPSSEQLQAMAKAALTEKETALSGEASTQGKDMASKPSLVSLASLAQAFSAQAKGLSNTLVNNIVQQLAAIQSKGAEVSPTITDSQASLANSTTNEAIVGENVSAIDDVKNSTKKLALDMNDQGLAQRLQQLLSTQALVTTPLNLTSPANSSNFVQGLIALVQLALAGRAMQRQPSLKSQIDAPDSIVSKTLANMGVTSQPSRLSQDINQLDNRHQMLAQLKTLLSSHQQNKIANVDSRIQGQESFYYILPSLSQHQNPPELLIKREYAGQQNKHAPTDQRTLWNITMKLDIGDSGKVLAKSKIDKSTITLDLYASNDEVLRRIGDTLPYLRKRLTSLGLAVENTSYQRGHIPDTLNSRPHQIFETKV